MLPLGLPTAEGREGYPDHTQFDPDDHHFDLTGYKQWAERAFGLMKQQGWLDWASNE